MDFESPAPTANFRSDSSTCETFGFDGETLTLLDEGRAFVLEPANLPIELRFKLVLGVDPVSGVNPRDFRNYSFMNIESGSLYVVGTSAELGVIDDVLLRGRVVGVDDMGSPTLEGYELLSEIEYIHPNLEQVVGNVNTIRYRWYSDLWNTAPGFESEPWQTIVPVTADNCLLTSPQLRLYSEAVPAPTPVTIEATGPINENTCKFVSDSVLETKVQYTFDARAKDIEPDPNVGQYLSCDDSYGSRSGVVSSIEGFEFRSSCVEIVVQNDVIGSSGDQGADIYQVYVRGGNQVGGVLSFFGGSKWRGVYGRQLALAGIDPGHRARSVSESNRRDECALLDRRCRLPDFR